MIKARFSFARNIFALVVLTWAMQACIGNDDGGSEDSAGQGQVERGLEQVNLDIRDNPDNLDLYVERAKLLKADLKFAEAYNDLDRVIMADSSRGDVFYERGKLLFEIGKVGEAKYDLERALAINDQDVGAMLQLAEIYLVLKNKERSMTYVNDALRVDDQLPKAYFLKGLIYKELGNSELSISSFQTVTELDPDNVEAFNLLGMMYAEQSDSTALYYYNTALEIDSTSREVLYNRAFYFQDQVKPALALSAYQDLLRHHPDAAVAHYNSGYIWMGLYSEPDSALVQFNEAIAKNPNYHQAFIGRGVVLEELGRVGEAKVAFQTALDISPNEPQAIAGLNRLN